MGSRARMLVKLCEQHECSASNRIGGQLPNDSKTSPINISSNSKYNRYFVHFFNLNQDRFVSYVGETGDG